MVDMNNSKSWAQGSRCYEVLRVIDDKKASRLLAQDSRFYELHRVVDNMNDFKSWA